MLKTVKLGGIVLRRAKILTMIERTFLSEAYQCNETWNCRLEDPVIKKVNPADMFFQLEQQYNAQNRVSAVDVDVFANSVQEEFQVDELISILLKHRASAETTNTLESTHHAVIRFLMKHNAIDLLHEMLNDRVHYGIFPDHHIMNVLMDTFIKKNEFSSAAQVAVLTMLQEDRSNSLVNALSLYSCHKYLENPDTWKLPAPEPVDKKVIKVRVCYIRNPYFDDHFDLREPRDLVGKTLAFLGKYTEGCLGRSCRLRGLVLYKKYDQAMELLNEWITKNEEPVIHKDVYDYIAQDIGHLPEDQLTEDLKELQSKVKLLSEKGLSNENLNEGLEKNVKLAVEMQTETDIEKQKQKYIMWNRTRETELQRYLNEQDRLSRLQHVEQMKKELEEKELLLTFFDKEEQIEMEIESKLQAESKEIERLGYRYTREMNRIRLLGEDKFMEKFMKVKESKNAND